MAYWGNILTIYDTEESVLSHVEQILNDLDTRFEKIDNTFFVESTSQENSRQITLQTTQAGIAHTLIFLHHKSKNALRAGNVDKQLVNRVRLLVIKSK
ncbi:MAG: hypothetical protein WD097_05540 [Balneolales bacterium]